MTNSTIAILKNASGTICIHVYIILRRDIPCQLKNPYNQNGYMGLSYFNYAKLYILYLRFFLDACRGLAGSFLARIGATAFLDALFIRLIP